MGNANIMADEIHNAGFRTKVLTSTAVKVSLNRPVSIMEVELCVMAVFGENDFNFARVSGEIILSW